MAFEKFVQNLFDDISLCSASASRLGDLKCGARSEHVIEQIMWRRQSRDANRRLPQLIGVFTLATIIDA
jgi:hypothetical protein